MPFRWIVIGSSFLYLVVLFGIAYLGEKRAQRGRSLVNNPYIYSLSLAVYCTAWTYYGSVGQAAQQGVRFLTTYLGPTLMAPLWWLVLRKIIRICKVQRITTLADFISARYGNNITLGSLVTVVCVLGVLPYISIQLKGIAASLSMILPPTAGSSLTSGWVDDTALYVTIGLAGFTILFGTRQVDTTERHEGMVTAIAFESLFKLVAFLAVGSYVTYGVYDGFGDLFSQANGALDTRALFVMPDAQYADWFWLTIVSMLAVFLLPRQFQVAVKENVDERHLRRAIWLFPLYLFLINLFVLPIALGGRLLLAGQAIDADMYVLAIPQYFEQDALTLVTFLGGLSAATSMIIVSTIALSTMVNNNLLVPVWLYRRSAQEFESRWVSRILVNSRRLIIIGILLLAYLYYKLVSERFSLVSIGLISFVAVAQLSPAVLGGIFWKRGTHLGALFGLLLGFAVWFFTLVVPTIVEAGLLPTTVLSEGWLGLPLLRPYPFLGLSAYSPVSQAIFWSLLFNGGGYCLVSLLSTPSAQESSQAEVFVSIFRYSPAYESSQATSVIARAGDIRDLLVKFLGEERATAALRTFRSRHPHTNAQQADYRMVRYAEQLLAGVIGSASAHVMVMSTVREENLFLEDLFQVLNESQQLVYANQKLQQKSEELEKIGQQLRWANEELKKMDHLKDEFISTVTHEMRTPITSIRAFSEILQDYPDLTSEEKNQFLSTITKEADRMERLIHQVLDLEKFESGKLILQLQPVRLNAVIQDALESVSQVVKERSIALQLDLSPSLPPIEADPDRLTQVILNLVSNAVKFCDADHGLIQISSYHATDHVRVDVMDNGVGVPPESQEMIFEGFFQAENQTTRKPVGSGLGLTISKKIVEYHRGHLWVESTLGQGARFSFTLPTVHQPSKQADA